MSGAKSWSGTRVCVTVCDVFETVENLASAVTGVLSPDGPLGMLTTTLTDALDGVWAEFFGSPTPPGGTNWNAYSHEELYQMLWQHADVGDVSTVAAEWGRHSTELTGYADALRREGEALRSNWQGRAAELAADRLAELSDKVWNVGARASTVQKAASDAGDALALARNTMPKPLPDPMTLMTSSVGAGPLSPLEAVLVGGARLFTADAVAGVSKAEAVHVMQRYESSLQNSGHQVVPGQPDATTSRTYQVDGLGGATTSAAGFSGGGSSGTGGVPWSRLVGGGAQPGPGGMVGAGPGFARSVLAAESAALSNAAAARAMGPGGFFPPMAPRAAGDEDKPHQSNLPNVDNGLFTVDQRSSTPVIGGVTDREHDIGL
jgi:hypothetical protein